MLVPVALPETEATVRLNEGVLEVQCGYGRVCRELEVFSTLAFRYRRCILRLSMKMAAS